MLEDCLDVGGMLENPDFLLCCCWGHLFRIGANVLALSQWLDHWSWASWENILRTVCDEQNVNFSSSSAGVLFLAICSVSTRACYHP